VFENSSKSHYLFTFHVKECPTNHLYKHITRDNTETVESSADCVALSRLPAMSAVCNHLVHDVPGLSITLYNTELLH
jgi:hypothetical protein